IREGSLEISSPFLADKSLKGVMPISDHAAAFSTTKEVFIAEWENAAPNVESLVFKGSDKVSINGVFDEKSRGRRWLISDEGSLNLIKSRNNSFEVLRVLTDSNLRGARLSDVVFPADHGKSIFIARGPFGLQYGISIVRTGEIIDHASFTIGGN